ncbi:hypothetical protein CIG75_02585 [Tumebacillus algifaecis]|uniref:Beta-lactamase-related domain-containing protein n=1 Tax=Tumebacillus algifaecis TaxID=1214604 RepID=A0A223CXE8_9BACL|nr:serine hydrolase [Tumebacillus algifaecis]ASS73976.1 hypothetical protein CIG75_02585 [Tumebacillus algifaecis]
MMGKESQHESAIMELHRYMQQVTSENQINGAVLVIEAYGQLLLFEAYGDRQTMPDSLPMIKDTIFDLASLSKVVAVLPAVLHLAGEGKLKLVQTLSSIFSLKAGEPLAKVTIVDLLTHQAGLSAQTFLKQYGRDKEQIIRGICEEPPDYACRTQVKYSNRGFVLLGEIIERVGGTTLDQYVAKNIWHPLGMTDTCYNPSPVLTSRIAPTEFIPELGACKKGIVHDENAEWLGGVAGHAGVFSTAGDLVKFCRMILDLGRYEGRQLLPAELVKESLRNHTQGLGESRGFGWDTFQVQGQTEPVFGHLGFTGTSLWISPQKECFGILLTNRVHPDRESQQIRTIRRNVLQKMIQAVRC